MTPSDIFSQLVAVFSEWKGFLKDPQYIRRGSEITWSGASNIVLPEPLTRQDTAQISRNGQYTFRVAEDDSAIQISYRFLAAGGLESARLAFYEVGAISYEEEIEVYPSGEEEDSRIPARWVRFDYSNTGLGRALHMDSHLHISGLPGTRFPVTGIPTPRQFVEFVAAHFYPAEYQRCRLNGDQQFLDLAQLDSVNSACIKPRDEQDEVYRRISHFRIPGS